MCNVKLTLRKDLILNTSNSQVSYFWNLEPIPNLHRFVFPFLPFMVDLAFGKILNILEESQ